jgi:hypothetical protein
MTAKKSELIFISQIKRDGTGVILNPSMPLGFNEIYTLHTLSLTHQTFIASGFNSFIVKLKK